MNALRSGCTWEEMSEMLPGLRPQCVLASYLDLDQRLDAATAAWRRICENPTLVTVTENATLAVQILPVPMHRISLILTSDQQANAERAVAAICTRIRDLAERSKTAENGLSRLTPGDRRGIELGRHLHDVAEPGIWSDEYFLPSRVGELSAVRVADLRGDVRS